MNRISRRFLISLHDLLATALAIVCSIYVRSDSAGILGRLDWLAILLPCILLMAAGVYSYLQLSRPKWRFFSLPDLKNVILAATIMGVAVLAVDYILLSSYLYGTFFFGKITIALYWLLQVAFLSGPRIAYRYFRYTRTQSRSKRHEAMPVLLVGRSAEVEILLRGVESGAISKLRPIGILSPSEADQRQAVRGIPVLGFPNDFENVVRKLQADGQAIGQIIIMPSEMAPELHPESIVMRARRLAISSRTVRSLPDADDRVAISPIKVEDLLLRPTADIDYTRLEAFVKGRSVVVTGGGGSIGSELCDRVLTFGAARLLVLENSEPALHAVLEKLAVTNANFALSKVEGRIADVRDRDRIFHLMADFKPDLVFHAAALKHVPILERDWQEGIKTNVLGSVVVADAALAAKAEAMVMISTDKAIEPVSILGATKRLAEMYCQALDAKVMIDTRDEAKPQTRFVSVRFGNVLASNGSVVPKFKAQIEAGGPVTVTHPEMIRYFMTIREACDLVVTAASHALSVAELGVGIYVLNMGQPVKIVDLAERMIRLSGLEPGLDVDIIFSGIRPGERLSEILFAQEEATADIGISGILAANPERPMIENVRMQIVALELALQKNDRQAALRVLESVSKNLATLCATGSDIAVSPEDRACRA